MNGRAEARSTKGAWALLAASAVVFSAGVGAAVATPGHGFTRQELAKGTLAEGGQFQADGPNDVVFRTVAAEPGGTSGWHSHPGVELAVAKSGTATLWVVDGDTCAKHIVEPGQAIMIPAGRVHFAANEANAAFELITMGTVPQGAQPTIDQPKPEVCASAPG